MSCPAAQSNACEHRKVADMTSLHGTQVRKLAFCIIIAASVLIEAQSIAKAQSSEVRLGHNRAWADPGLILGITRGYFSRAGVTVSEKVFNNPADIVQAIATGDLDAGVSSSGVLLTAIQRGVKVKAVAVAQGSQMPPVTFMVRNESDIRSPPDLKGKTAVIAGFGGTADLMLRYWLDKGGVDPKNEVTVKFVPFHLTLPSLINRQVDAAPLDAMLSIRASEEYPGQLRKLFSYADVSNGTIGSDHVNALLLVFGSAFIERNRAAAIRFLEAYLLSIRAIQADPKTALNDWAQASEMPIIRKLEAPVSLPADGKVYLDALRFEADQALHFGYLKEPADIAAAVDNSLVEEANTKLK
jgi:ABC-type nitrate/sulfonate/bicarbonate transport system substrate-binding protein